MIVAKKCSAKMRAICFHRGIYFPVIFICFMALLPQCAWADGISDAEDLYGKCLGDKRKTLAQCRNLYLDALDKQVKEISGQFIRRHKDFLDPDDTLVKYVLEDIAKEQKKWREYKSITCKHLLEKFVFGTHGPDILFTECRALVLKQRIQLLRHIFCAGDDFESCAKEWKIEQSSIPSKEEEFDAGLEKYTQGDWDGAFKTFQSLAEQGYAAAQYNLGTLYFQGHGVQKDETKALEWSTKAAQQGYATAQYNLGMLYSRGIGVQKDEAKALEWYTKAAQQGLAAAQNSLGWLYCNGRGVPQDTAKAFEWFNKAAQQGYAQAQYNLFLMYYKGQGVKQDKAQAEAWLRKAAAQGDPQAQKKWGELFGDAKEGAQ